jgi:tetratricopeptide (TPR) repeat protein
LLTLAENRGHPPIARATALHLLSEYMSRLAPIALLKGAQDPDPLVRQVAAVGLQDIPESERITPLLPLLVDSILAVRIAAANALMTASPLIPDSARANYHAALAESRSAMDANAYFPGGRFNLGQYYEKQGVADSAVLAYSAALDLDNRFIPARINLAQLLDRMGRTEESKAHFRASIHFNPEYGDAYYFLGLLLAGQSQLDSAVVYLELASLKLPRNPRIHYNFGLVLQKLGRLEDAANALQRSLALTGEDPEYLYTLAWLYTISKQWNKAMEILPRLAVVAPQHPGLAGLLMEASRYPKKRPRSTLAR